MRIYIAAGWFTPEQEKARQDVLNVLSKYVIREHIFSPKEDSVLGDWDEVFQENLRQISRATFVVASTVGKDMGTLFECGYAHNEGIPIVYYAPGLEGDFNLMLAKSAQRVCTSKEDLMNAMMDDFRYKEYVGEIE
jgi:nucleoside 2-deoxyribosyltransferase